MVGMVLGRCVSIGVERAPMLEALVRQHLFQAAQADCSILALRSALVVTNRLFQFSYSWNIWNHHMVPIFSHMFPMVSNI